MMNILLLGSGGREHALAWKLAQSKHCDQLFIAPGNPGTATLGTNLPIAATDFDAIAQACTKYEIGLVMVGPEDPLVQGIVDDLKARPATVHIPVIGPSKAAAQLEGSKAFAKAFMQRHGIPTASYQSFDASTFDAGLAYIHEQRLPVVVKADGLAAGKGVIIAQTHAEAVEAYTSMIQASQFGQAGDRVVIESFLTGVELSVFVLTDGKHFHLLPEAKDYKRIGEGDTGLNTGGMGAVSPVPFATPEFLTRVIHEVAQPTVEGLAKDGMEYRGIIFLGLINVDGAPYVIEYNCRFGDPETEAVLPRLENDLVELLLATYHQTLDQHQINIAPLSAATVVTVSGGYPGAYPTGLPISNWEAIADSHVFHAGTTHDNGLLLTKGGRVFAITSLAPNLEEAVQKSKLAASQIQYAGKYFRADIGYEFL